MASSLTTRYALSVLVLTHAGRDGHCHRAAAWSRSACGNRAGDVRLCLLIVLGSALEDWGAAAARRATCHLTFWSFLGAFGPLGLILEPPLPGTVGLLGLDPSPTIPTQEEFNDNVISVSTGREGNSTTRSC